MVEIRAYLTVQEMNVLGEIFDQLNISKFLQLCHLLCFAR